MIDTWFYEDGLDQPVKLDFDPSLSWMKKNVVKTSFIVGLDGEIVCWVLSKGLYLGNPEDAMVGYPDISSAWEASWEDKRCKACAVNLTGDEERLGFCIDCAVDILNNLDESLPEPEDAMFEGHPALEVKKTAYWMCSCGTVNKAVLDHCMGCDDPMINGVEVTLNIVEPKE